MGQSVKLADALTGMVRREAKAHNRSIAGQVSHRLKIGRSIEQSGKLNYQRVNAALCGKIYTTALTELEEIVWDDAFIAKIGQPTEAENALWFMTLADARDKLEDWQRNYTEVRPHGAIGCNALVDIHNLGREASLLP